MITYESPQNLRQIIICSTLSERPVQIKSYRAFQSPQGIENHEVKFLRLVQMISNGAQFQISKTGTFIKYYPGIIINNDGNEIQYDCGQERNITYFLEPLIILALFGQSNLNIRLFGLTNDDLDISVDSFLNATIPIVKHFGVDGGIEMKVIKRGFRPLGGGQVHFQCSFVKYLKAVNLNIPGKIKRVRGVCTGGQIAPSLLSSVISSTRLILNDYLPDVWIYSDYFKGPQGGQSSGYAISLVAEFNSGSLISVDSSYVPDKKNKESNLPENLGKNTALKLLHEVLSSGYIDTANQSLVLNLMALSEKKASRVRLGMITAYTVENLRILRDFFGVIFKIENITQEMQLEEEKQLVQLDGQGSQQKVEEIDQEKNSEEKEIVEPEEFKQVNKVIFSCYGIGLNNISRIVL